VELYDNNDDVINSRSVIVDACYQTAMKNLSDSEGINVEDGDVEIGKWIITILCQLMEFSDTWDGMQSG